MTTVMIILVAAALGLALARWWRIPSTPALILVGVALGALEWSGDDSTLRNTLLLGLTFVVFLVGTEMDIAGISGRWRAAAGVALAQFVVLAGLVLVVATLLGFSLLPTLYIALAITASSTLVVVGILRQRGVVYEPVGRLIFGILLVQDILVVILLPVVTRFDAGAGAIMSGMGATFGLIVLMAFCRRHIVPLLVLRLKPDEESLLLAVLAVLFGFVGIAHLMGLPLVSGAFLAGVALSRLPVSGIVRGQLHSLGDFFIAVFFVTLGAAVELPAWRSLLLEGAMLLGIVLIMPPLVFMNLRRAGLSLRAAIQSAHLLANCGEFSVIILLLGVEYGHVDADALGIIVLLAVVTLSIGPWLATDNVTWKFVQAMTRRRRDRLGEPPQGHVLLLGCGSESKSLITGLLERGEVVVVVDDEAGALRTAEAMGARTVRGDGADYWLLRAVGARHARAIVSTMRHVSDHERLLRLVSGPHVIIRVFDPGAGRRLREMGATVVVEAEAAAEACMAWINRNMNARATTAAQGGEVRAGTAESAPDTSSAGFDPADGDADRKQADEP